MMAYLYDKKARTPRSEASSNRIQPLTLYKQYQSDLERISRAVIGELHIQTNNEYIKIPNILKAQGHQSGGNAGGMETVTWCTCCSESNLYNLPELATEWKGPISVTVFTTVSKVSQTLKYISALYSCNNNIRQRVSFHLCLPAQLIANVSLEISQNFNPTYCKELDNFDGYYLPNYVDTQVPFPVNVLRNVAIETCKTPYVLNADIDLRPSAGLYDDFVTFARSYPESSYPKTAFVLPSFETNQSTINSLSKDRLIQLWEKGIVRPFYSTVCYGCQKYTHYNRWKLLDASDGLQMAYHVSWVVPWEPYVVINKALAPPFNERFKQYGYNRISQVELLSFKSV